MTIQINATRAKRKQLVQSISEYLGVPARYLGAPSFGYEIDCFTIDKSGSLTFDDSADSETVEGLLECLAKEGFDIDQSHAEDETDASPTESTEDEPCNLPRFLSDCTDTRPAPQGRRDRPLPHRSGSLPEPF